jgi:outer membrane protein assembly factor BamD (BamD/ComL family)
MSIAGILASSFLAGGGPSAAQNKPQRIQQDFQQLGQDLKSGNLTQAQSDFSTLQQDLKQGSVSGHHTRHQRPVLSQDPVQQSSTPSLFAQLGGALQSGNLTAAQKAYATLQQDFLQFASTSPFSSNASTGSASASPSLNVSA